MRCKYLAKSHNAISLKIDWGDIPLELHQMIVWCILEQDKAMPLLHAYRGLRGTEAIEVETDDCGRVI
jgi:hypothetical protein